MRVRRRRRVAVRFGEQERGGASRGLVQFGLGHFDDAFLPNFELKCTEE
jgi:hypothetical protein